MRFIPGGPDIPNGLIEEWRRGDVIFLAGAGVSAPSNLPLFEGLALEVYEVLKDPLHGVLQKAKAVDLPPDRKRLLDSADLPPQKRVEADLFFEKQFDRLFSAMEKRIDPDLPGRIKTRKVRAAVESILGRGAFSSSHADLLQLSLAPNSADDRSKPLACRLVTTNFDLLFELAWKAVLAREPLSFDARMAPRPGAHNFDGIIHLHGRLSGDESLRGNYVLSSRDFARVYLRSGVIGNYIYDLIRRYRAVLIGYSADDPPMRYLMDAIGEDSSLFDDMRKPYAATDLGVALNDPAAAVEEASWLNKEIVPIFYQRADGGSPFDPLWQSIHEWAEWSRGEFKWIERKLEEHTAVKRSAASAFQRAFVQDLLTLLSQRDLERAVRFLTNRRVDFSWIETVNAAAEAAKSSNRAGA